LDFPSSSPLHFLAVSNEKVQIPSRFESLEHMAPSEEERSLIVRPVKAALAVIDEVRDDMESAGQGAFMVLQGLSGSGKSTFLHTLHLFREGVRTLRVELAQPVDEALDDLLEAPERLRVVVLADRDVPARVTDEEIERALHAINQFIRSREGRRTLVVWPCNSDEVVDRIVAKADLIGRDALLGLHPRGYHFDGPPKSEYIEIAQKTIAALNGGASMISFGITDERARQLAEQAPTMGAYLHALRGEERRNRSALFNLLPEKERYNLWVVVIAGNEPETEVATLTSGAYFGADIDRLLASTDANVVQDLKRYPAKLGLLARSFDARILHVPFMTALAVVRDVADDDLRKRLAESGFTVRGSGDGVERLAKSQLARALRAEPVTPLPAGRPPGDQPREEFVKFTQFARVDDGALNRTMAEALRRAGLIESFKAEDPVPGAQRRNTDILCALRDGSVRLEFMWRATTNVGEIARYVLEKLYSYGRAIGFLNGG
jgi:DNA (cytosine-5)-methyltransferase 1